MLETKRGIEVAEMGRFTQASRENQDRNCKELHHKVHGKEEEQTSEIHGAQTDVDEWSPR